MGFGTSASEVILFIGAVLVAMSVSGALGITSHAMAGGIKEKGILFEEQMKTDFEIINDPDDVPYQGGEYIFYIKNTGRNNFYFTNNTISVLMDGQMVSQTDIRLSNSNGALRRSEVSEIALSISLSSGYHTIKIILSTGKSREMVFNV